MITSDYIENLLLTLQAGRLSEIGRQELRDAGYHVGTREAYPVAISQPPAGVSGHRVIAWAEVMRRDGNYPGGIVLAVDAGRDFDSFAVWEVYTKDGGQTWQAYGGTYITRYEDAWDAFTSLLRNRAYSGTLATGLTPLTEST